MAIHIGESDQSRRSACQRRLETRIRHVRTVVDAAIANGFFENIQTPLRKFLDEVVRIQGHYSVVDLLELLLSRSGTESRSAMIREWIAAPTMPWVWLMPCWICWILRSRKGNPYSKAPP